MLEHQLVLVSGPRAGHHQRLEERVQPAPTPLSPRLPSPGSLRSDLHPPNERLSLALDQLLGSRRLHRQPLLHVLNPRPPGFHACRGLTPTTGSSAASTPTRSPARAAPTCSRFAPRRGECGAVAATPGLGAAVPPEQD